MAKKGYKQPPGFMSAEHKRKISEAQKGRKFSDEHRAKLKGRRPHARVWNRGLPWPEEQRKKWSEKKKGQRPWNTGLKLHYPVWNKGLKGFNAGPKASGWKGGITPINQTIRHSLEYRLWRASVFERDKYRCIWCGDDKGGNLEADHIKPFCNYPELRFAIDNGRTLCHECHKTTSTYGRKATKH